MDVDGYTMWVSDGSLLIVAPQVTTAERQAVLASLRFARQVADEMAGSRFSHYRHWYGAYRKALGGRGWGVTHSCQSTETAARRSVLAPLQPLLLWLSALHPRQAEVLDRCVAALQPQAGLEQLSRCALMPWQGGARIVLELGLVQPGPHLSLGRIALETTCMPATDWLTSTLQGAHLQGDLCFQGMTLEPAPELTTSPEVLLVCHGASRAIH